MHACVYVCVCICVCVLGKKGPSACMPTMQYAACMSCSHAISHWLPVDVIHCMDAAQHQKHTCLCSQVTNISSNEGLVLGGLTNTTTNLCHSDGGSFVDCITPGNATNKSNSDIPNLGPTACDASPNTLNIDCSGNKDNGNVTVCYLNEQPDFFSFDPTKLDAATATVNGVPVDFTSGRRSRPDCNIRDCIGDGVNDFECSFPTCSGNTSIAADGVLTMITNFTGSEGGLTCTTTVGTSGQGT